MPDLDLASKCAIVQAPLPLAANEVEHAAAKIKIRISMNGDAVLQEGADRVALIAPRTMNR